MKTTKTEFGWTEVTTKCVIITDPLPREPFMKVSQWIESNKRIGLYRRRKSCKCCKTAWEKFGPDEGLYLVFTDKGIKTICQKCHSELKEILK